MNCTTRSGATATFYILVILALIATSFTILHLKTGKTKEEEDAPPPSTMPELSTTISTNDMFCMNYICDYSSKEATSGISSYRACEEACQELKQCKYFTFTLFRNKPKCYLLQDCHLESPVQGCQSGPRNCYLWVLGGHKSSNEICISYIVALVA